MARGEHGEGVGWGWHRGEVGGGVAGEVCGSGGDGGGGGWGRREGRRRADHQWQYSHCQHVVGV